MEIKGQSSTDKELAQQLDRFTFKVRILKNHLPELAEEMSYEGEVSSISGIFVSVGHPDLEYNDPDVTFLDYDGLIEELHGAGAPRRLRALLQPARVYHLIEDLATDAWFKANDEIDEPMEGVYPQ